MKTFIQDHKVLCILLTLGLTLCLCFYHGTMTLKVEEWQLFYPDLPANTENIKILQLSDIHLNTLPIKPETINNAITKINPDIVVITGDTVASDKDLAKLDTYLGGITDPLGKYMVMGNNDYHLSREGFQTYLTRLADLGWQPLFNQSVHLESKSLWLIGLDDPSYRRDNPQKAFADVANSNDTSFRLVLAHSTNTLENSLHHSISDYGADLLLTGHTHGGQITPPFLGTLVRNTRLSYKGIYKGYHTIGNIPTYISRGIGGSSTSLRLNALPEITVFTLRKGDSSPVHTTQE